MSVFWVIRAWDVCFSASSGTRMPLRRHFFVLGDQSVSEVKPIETIYGKLKTANGFYPCPPVLDLWHPSAVLDLKLHISERIGRSVLVSFRKRENGHDWPLPNFLAPENFSPRSYWRNQIGNAKYSQTKLSFFEYHHYPIHTVYDARVH